MLGIAKIHAFYVDITQMDTAMYFGGKKFDRLHVYIAHVCSWSVDICSVICTAYM